MSGGGWKVRQENVASGQPGPAPSPPPSSIAPVSSVAIGTLADNPIIRALVGDRCSSFVNRWERKFPAATDAESVPWKVSLPLPAILGFPYMAYRRMYTHAALILAGHLGWIFGHTMYPETFPIYLASLICYGLLILPPLYFDSMYLRHLARKENNIRFIFSDEPNQIRAAIERGGIDWKAAGISIAAGPIILVVISFSLVLL